MVASILSTYSITTLVIAVIIAALIYKLVKGTLKFILLSAVGVVFLIMFFCEPIRLFVLSLI